MSYKLRNVVCENCKFFKRHKEYTFEGICTKDNQYTREYRVCDKLPTNTDKRNAKINKYYRKIDY